jgi:hypothetical protein
MKSESEQALEVFKVAALTAVAEMLIESLQQHLTVELINRLWAQHEEERWRSDPLLLMPVFNALNPVMLWRDGCRLIADVFTLMAGD